MTFQHVWSTGGGTRCPMGGASKSELSDPLLHWYSLKKKWSLPICNFGHIWIMVLRNSQLIPPIRTSVCAIISSRLPDGSNDAVTHRGPASSWTRCGWGWECSSKQRICCLNSALLGFCHSTWQSNTQTKASFTTNYSYKLAQLTETLSPAREAGSRRLHAHDTHRNAAVCFVCLFSKGKLIRPLVCGVHRWRTVH